MLPSAIGRYENERIWYNETAYSTLTDESKKVKLSCVSVSFSFQFANSVCVVPNAVVLMPTESTPQPQTKGIWAD